MARVIHFEIHADEPERAVQFYRRVFGWEFRAHDGDTEYWFITTGPPEEKGINGGLVRRTPGPTAAPPSPTPRCSTPAPPASARS